MQPKQLKHVRTNSPSTHISIYRRSLSHHCGGRCRFAFPSVHTHTMDRILRGDRSPYRCERSFGGVLSVFTRCTTARCLKSSTEPTAPDKEIGSTIRTRCEMLRGSGAISAIRKISKIIKM